MSNFPPVKQVESGENKQMMLYLMSDGSLVEGTECPPGICVTAMEMTVETLEEFMLPDVVDCTPVGIDLLSTRIHEDPTRTDEQVESINCSLIPLGKTVLCDRVDFVKPHPDVIAEIASDSEVMVVVGWKGQIQEAALRRFDKVTFIPPPTFDDLIGYAKNSFVFLIDGQVWCPGDIVRQVHPARIGDHGFYCIDGAKGDVAMEILVNVMSSFPRPAPVVYQEYWEIEKVTAETALCRMTESVIRQPRPADFLSVPRLTGSFPKTAEFALVSSMERITGSPLGPFLYQHAQAFVREGGSFSIDSCSCGCKPVPTKKVLSVHHYWGRLHVERAIVGILSQQLPINMQPPYDPLFSFKVFAAAHGRGPSCSAVGYTEAAQIQRIYATTYDAPSVLLWPEMIKKALSMVKGQRFTDWVKDVYTTYPALYPGLFVWQDVLYVIHEDIVTLVELAHAFTKKPHMAEYWCAWLEKNKYEGNYRMALEELFQPTVLFDLSPLVFRGEKRRFKTIVFDLESRMVRSCQYEGLVNLHDVYKRIPRTGKLYAARMPKCRMFSAHVGAIAVVARERPTIDMFPDRWLLFLREWGVVRGDELGLFEFKG